MWKNTRASLARVLNTGGEGSVYEARVVDKDTIS